MRDFLTIVICIIIAGIVALLASENITTIKGYSSLMAITATGFIIHWLDRNVFNKNRRRK